MRERTAIIAAALARAPLILSLLALGSPLHAIEPPRDADQHWSFHAPREVAPPTVRNEAWIETDIDRFILAKLEAANLRPASPADPRTLIRRMSLDLTGLPPTAEEVDAFTRECETGNRKSAIENLIALLLASPRYGERWGRHWLDVARYSDTKGYVYAREERFFVHAPFYRDWVIRAFNEDLPYDRFLQLQIAADQLVAPDSPDLVAMGFVTGGRRFIGVTHDIIDDRIDVVTRGTMALTASCSRCHDHKYDPIPIEDYYSLYGVFRAGDDRLVPLAPSDDKELAKRREKFAAEMLKARNEAAERLRKRVGDYLAAQTDLGNYPEEGFDQILYPDALFPASVRRWRDYLAQSADPRIFAPWRALAAVPANAFEKDAPAALAASLAGGKVNALIAATFSTAPKTLAEAAARYGKAFADAESDKSADAEELRRFLHDPHSPTTVPDTGIVNNELYFPTNICEHLWKLQGEVDRRCNDIAAPHALILADRADDPNPRVFKRGKASRLGDEVPRQFLEVLAGEKRAPFAKGSGRLELARAIASPENPLTARVMVNRIWQHHFGTGLVKTPSDFGLRAETPSHPELLDWLARRFIASGWSVKEMHRLILHSAVWQQAAATHESPLPANDPDNRLLSHFPRQRLDFEQLRDSMLAAARQLDFTQPARPPTLLDRANNRRTVFALVDRQFLPGTFRVFDFANPDLHVATRHETTIPQQALFFLNGTFAADRARAIAKRASSSDDAARIREIHRAIFQRDPQPAELAAATNFISAARADALPETPEQKPTQWTAGYGEYDPAAKKLKHFAPLPHYTGSAWQGGSAWSDGKLGWAQITADGGHPGNDHDHACIRRWTAPADGTITITGKLRHEPEQGDGIDAFIHSSRHGELARATAHHSAADLTAGPLEIKAGDTIDFIVDVRAVLNSDQFLWSPTIATTAEKWDAKTGFTGPTPRAEHLTPWEQYAHVLLLSNEFAFAD